MRKIKKNDKVVVITGKCKNQKGVVLSVKDDRVKVEGVNLVKKHQKANPDKGIEGGIITKEAYLHISNIAHFDEKSNKPSRVGFRILENGKKVRYLKTSNEVIDV